MADRVDRRVDAAPLGRRLDRGSGILLGEVDRLGAERPGEVETLGDRVDSDHPLGAACQRRLDRAQADRAEAEDGGGGARLDAGLGDRVPARSHHVAGEQGDVVGHPRRHMAQGEVRVGHEQQLRLGAGQRAKGRAVAEDPPVVALVEVPASAEEALAAGGAVGAEHAVALADAADAVARGDHGADVLVADHEPGLDRDPTVVDVQVRAADAARLDADDRLVGAGQLGLGDLVDAHLAGGLEGHRSHAPGL